MEDLLKEVCSKVDVKVLRCPSNIFKYLRHMSPDGGSTRITSAPCSANILPALGPATTVANSKTRTPFRMGALLPMAPTGNK